MITALNRPLLISALVIVMICAPVAAFGGDRLVLGVHPYLSATDLQNRFTPLAEHLSRITGLRVEIEISRDYAKHIEKVGKNEYDVAYMGPASYVQLVEQYGRRPIVAGVEVNGKRSFVGFIIAPEKGDMEKLSDVKGRRFAFGDPDSTMSHLVPLYMLLKEGITLDDLAGYAFLGSHDNVALSVLVGDFDAGAVKEETYYKYAPQGLKVIAMTPSIAEHIFVARDGIPDGLLKKLRNAMLALRSNENGRHIMTLIKKDITGFVEVDDSEYDTLREIFSTLRKAGVEP